MGEGQANFHLRDAALSLAEQRLRVFFPHPFVISHYLNRSEQNSRYFIQKYIFATLSLNVLDYKCKKCCSEENKKSLMQRHKGFTHKGMSKHFHSE